MLENSLAVIATAKLERCCNEESFIDDRRWCLIKCHRRQLRYKHMVGRCFTVGHCYSASGVPPCHLDADHDPREQIPMGR